MPDDTGRNVGGGMNPAARTADAASRLFIRAELRRSTRFQETNNSIGNCLELPGETVLSVHSG